MIKFYNGLKLPIKWLKFYPGLKKKRGRRTIFDTLFRSKVLVWSLVKVSKVFV